MTAHPHHLYLPGSLDARACWLLLHGTGGSEHDLVPLAQRLLPGAAILSPRGDVLERGAARFFRRLAEGVFDLEDVRQRTHRLADFVEDATARHSLRRESLLALGFSNGANIAGTLLQLRPGLLRAAVLLRPMVVLDQPADPGSLAGVEILLANGDADPLVPPDHPPRLASHLRAGGAQVELHVTPAAGHGLVTADLAAAEAFVRRVQARLAT